MHLHEKGKRTMEIKQPLCITSRLLPGVKIGEATISIEYAHIMPEGRRVYCWYIDGVGEENFHSYDLKSGAGGGTLQEGLESLLGCLGAFAAARDPRRLWFTEPENYNLFPAELAEWAIENADEIACLECDLQENPGKFIVE